MDNRFHQDMDELEKDVHIEIIRMEAESDAQSGNIIREAANKLQQLFQASREYMQHAVTSDEMHERFQHVKQESSRILAEARQAVHTLMQRDEVQVGTKKLKESGNKLWEKVQTSVDEVMEHPYVSKSVDKITATIETVKNDERVADGIKKLKQGTLKAAESAYKGLKRVLDTEDEEKERKG